MLNTWKIDFHQWLKVEGCKKLPSLLPKPDYMETLEGFWFRKAPLLFQPLEALYRTCVAMKELTWKAYILVHLCCYDKISWASWL